MVVDPIGLFDSLDKSHSTVKKLRKAQQEVLEMYLSKFRDSPRLGVRLPTGAGKSHVALLILESWRREGFPVAILAASIGLAQDLEAKCKELEIPAVTIFGQEDEASARQLRVRNLTQYKLHRAIGIFNYHSYLYSTEYRQETVPPRVMVIDDANEFELVRNEFFTVRIDRDKFPDAYNAVLEALRPHFQVYPNLPAFLDKTARKGAVEVIHFTHSNEVLGVIATNVRSLNSDLTFRLSYDRNKETLKSFVIFVTEDEVELRPLIVPEGVLKLAKISQVIFMGATLYEHQLLRKSLGIYNSPIDVLTEEDLSQQARDEMDKFGKRLILPVDTATLVSAPGKIPLETIESIAKMHGKLLVLANSKWVASAILNYLPNGSAIFYRYFPDAQRFKAMKEGVLVCANRYIGLDFPGDTVKACCIVTLPVYLEPVDAFYDQVLFDTQLIQYKVANRLTQAFGRCNRLESDEAVYYILDPRILARFTGEEQFFRFFPRRIHAELFSGFYLSEEGNPAAAFDYAKNKFFNQKEANYDRFMKEEKGLWTRPSISWEDAGSQEEIQAWEKSLQESFETSASMFNSLCERTKGSNPLLGAWFSYLAALNYYNAYTAYHQPQALTKCQESLRKAMSEGSTSSWFNRLGEVLNELVEDTSQGVKVDTASIEARRIKEQISADYDNFVNMNNSRKKTWQAAFTDLRMNLRTGTHGEMLVAVEEMFGMMGYKPKRGDKNKGEPDLIAISAHTLDKYQLSIELKTKEEGETEKKESVSQTLTDAKVIGKRAADYLTVPLLITQKEKFSEDAIRSAQKEVILLRTEGFDILLGRLYSRIERWISLTSVHQQQAFIDSIISPHELLKLFTVGESPEVTAKMIESEVPDI